MCRFAPSLPGVGVVIWPLWKRLLLACAVATVAFTAVADAPLQTDIIVGLDEQAMRARLSELDLQPMEGIWYYPDEHLTLGIERWHGPDEIAYRIVLLSSPDLELLPGMVIGYLAPTAVATKFRLWLYSERSRLTLKKPMETVATVADNTFSTITFVPPHWRVRVRVNVTRFLPSIFRAVSISPEKVAEQPPRGFHKIFPHDTDGQPFARVRYL